MAEGLIVRRVASRVFDNDAAAYIAAVEEADGQALEPEIRLAYNRFVLGCKDDGIWDAIKASCIMAGARTLSGALVPLVGPAPTNFNFVSGDYDRVTGLIGNASNKYLDTGVLDNTNPQNNNHFSAFFSSTGTFGTRAHMSTGFDAAETAPFYLSDILRFQSDVFIRNSAENQSFALGNRIAHPASGLIGTTRNNASNFTFIANQNMSTINVTSVTPIDSRWIVYARDGSPPTLYSDARLSFYSIGEHLDLEALDNRTTALINAIEDALT